MIVAYTPTPYNTSVKRKRGTNMLKLYIVRHGKTLFNEKHLIQGCCDSPLTAEGI